MKDRKTKISSENPALDVNRRLLELARLIRRTGSPDQAVKAAEWEKRIQEDTDQQPAELATAA